MTNANDFSNDGSLGRENCNRRTQENVLFLMRPSHFPLMQISEQIDLCDSTFSEDV